MDGYVIGTAPICEATCDVGCPGRACIDHIPGNVNSSHPFMPDAGHLCINEGLQIAEDLFWNRTLHLNETLLDIFKDVEFTSAGKACCCATRLPRIDSFKHKDQPTSPGTFSCDSWCQEGGFGHGVTIGTAPTCGASCDTDCAGSVCAVSNSFFSDHGAGCATGNKVCCCAKQAPNRSVADEWKYTKEILPPQAKLPSPFSCSDMCNSGGWGTGSVQGTAPFCGASCTDCDGKCFTVDEGDVTDYGHGCATGDKVCCCDKNAT